MADDLMVLQRQAARRVQQMQEHSRRVFEAHQGERPPHSEEHPLPQEHRSSLPCLESEQWLLLGLALLLMRCGGRMELTLALLYLAL